MSKNLKFGLLAVIILGTLGWLAAGGVEQTATYYKEIAELQQMQKTGPKNLGKGLIERCRGIETKLRRLRCPRRRIGREIESAR